jgi:hypothetical protein
MFIFELTQILIRDNIVENVENRVIGVLSAFSPMFAVVPGFVRVVVPVKVPVRNYLVFPDVLDYQAVLLVDRIVIDLLLSDKIVNGGILIIF